MFNRILTDSMQFTKKSFYKGKVFNVSIVYLFLALSGLSFCFFLGFPFDNHNESYIWVIAIKKASFLDTLTKQIYGGIETFRPLGMANAWLSYRLTGNIYLQQILNWLFALSSFTLLFIVIKNKRPFSLLSFITCACFFSGYIYLFHLHGVFYGPFQLYAAALTCIAYRQEKLSAKMLILVSFVTLITCLYHTFALLIFCAFLAGYLVKAVEKKERIEIAKLIILILLAIIAVKIILQGKEMKSLENLAGGFFTSYRMAEINPTLSLLASAMAVLTGIQLTKSVALKIISCVAIILLSALLMYADIPVLLLWIAICLLKITSEKNWPMAGLIASTSILPLGSGSGSPTYVVFVLMICTFVAASDMKLHIPDSFVVRRLILFFIAMLFCCIAAIKAGYEIPVFTFAAKPLLGEQEKTRQLKDILAWKMTDKEYASFGLILYDTISSLTDKEYTSFGLTLYDKMGTSGNAKKSIDRVHRPVTDQAGINTYLDAFSNNTANAAKSPSLYITFGDKILKNKQLVFSVAGKWNGKACVFR